MMAKTLIMKDIVPYFLYHFDEISIG